MGDLLQEVGWTNLGCVPNVPPTSIHLFSWNSLENKELCAESLNSPIRASYFTTTCSAISWMSYKREQPGKIYFIPKAGIWGRRTVVVAARQFFSRWEVLSGWVASLKSSSLSCCVFRGEPTDCSSVTLFSLRNSSEIKILELVQCSSCRNNWTGSSFHPSSVRLRVQLWV